MRASIAAFFLLLTLSSQASVRLYHARLINVGSDFVSYVCGVEDLSEYGACEYPRTIKRVLRVSVIVEVDQDDPDVNGQGSIYAPRTYAVDFPAEQFSADQLVVLTSTDYQAALRLFTELFDVEGLSVRLKASAP